MMPRTVSLLLFGLTLALSAFVQNNSFPPGAPPPVAEPDFEAETLDDSVAIGYGLAIGDVDGDGRSDILLADKKQFVWYRNDDWTRFVMVDSLTERDNVAIAARDINGDGRVEVAVGAQWNPGETSDLAQSGSVHYLIRPDDPTQPWTPVQLTHEPTTHRMGWVRVDPETYHLVVLPLHGRDNEQGKGPGVRVLAYAMPDDPSGEWSTVLLDDQMHMTHNFDVVPSDATEQIIIGGREGLRFAIAGAGQWSASKAIPVTLPDGAGEVRQGRLGDGTPFLTAIEPMHGHRLTAYVGASYEPHVLDTTFAQGHALATADLLGLGRDQIVAGWRSPNADEKVGIKLYVPDETGSTWTSHVIDDNTMATEDLKVADLNDDGRLDIIAAGRDTHNLIVYWNRSGGE